MLLKGIVSFRLSANVRITNEKNKRQIPLRASRGLKWKKQNIQAKEVYWLPACFLLKFLFFFFT